VLFFSGSLIRGSYVCIIFVFLDSPAFQALWYIYLERAPPVFCLLPVG
jgi:hypothetical protein